MEPDTPLEPGGHNRVSVGQEDEVQIEKRRSWNQVKRLEEKEELEPDTPLESGGHNRMSLGQEDEVEESNGSAQQESCKCTGSH